MTADGKGRVVQGRWLGRSGKGEMGLPKTAAQGGATTADFQSGPR